MCGGTLITRTNDIKNMLKTYQAGNVKYLDKSYVLPCLDTYTWCPENIAAWRKTTPDICKGGYVVNEEPLNIICKKSCNLCSGAYSTGAQFSTYTIYAILLIFTFIGL